MAETQDKASYDAALALEEIRRHEQGCNEKYKGIFAKLEELSINQATMIANEARNRWILYLILTSVAGLFVRLMYKGLV